MITIYKILSPDLQECYVGSSKDFLHRIAVHKQYTYQNSPCRSMVLFEKYGFDNCSFVIVEQCESTKRIEKEQWWLDHSVGCVNRNNPIKLSFRELHAKKKEQEKITNKAYRERNTDEIAEKKRQYYEKNKEKILEMAKQRYALSKLI